MLHHRFGNRPTDIVEVTVHAVRSDETERLADVLGLVVNAGIKAQFVDYVRDLLVGPGDAYDTAAADLRDLSNNGSDSARCGGNDHGVARLRFAHV